MPPRPGAAHGRAEALSPLPLSGGPAHRILLLLLQTPPPARTGAAGTVRRATTSARDATSARAPRAITATTASTVSGSAWRQRRAVREGHRPCPPWGGLRSASFSPQVAPGYPAPASPAPARTGAAAWSWSRAMPATARRATAGRTAATVSTWGLSGSMLTLWGGPTGAIACSQGEAALTEPVQGSWTELWSLFLRGGHAWGLAAEGPELPQLAPAGPLGCPGPAIQGKLPLHLLQSSLRAASVGTEAAAWRGMSPSASACRGISVSSVNSVGEGFTHAVGACCVCSLSWTLNAS